MELYSKLTVNHASTPQRLIYFRRIWEGEFIGQRALMERVFFVKDIGTPLGTPFANTRRGVGVHPLHSPQ
jgi:hypothetical protein